MPNHQLSLVPVSLTIDACIVIYIIYNIQCKVIRIYENILQKLLKDLLQGHLHQGNLVPLQLLDESRLTGQQEYHRAPGRT